MFVTILCLEKKDFHRVVDIARQYAPNDLEKCYVFNKRGYTAEIYKEKIVNGVKCVIFGWSKYRLNLAGMKNGYDLVGINFEIKKAPSGYILMELKNGKLINYKNESKRNELETAMNINKIIKNEISLEYLLHEQKNKKEEIVEFE